MGQLRVAFRLARRDARRRRIRSLAIVATLALPIGVATTVDVVARSDHLTVTERLHRQLGNAEAMINGSGGYPLAQAPDPTNGSVAIPAAPFQTLPAGQAPVAPPPAADLPPDAVLIPEVDAYTFLVSSRAGGFENVRGLDIRSSTVSPLVVLDSGRPPALANEVTVTARLARRFGVGIGASLVLPGTAAHVKVVGIAHSRYAPHGDVLYALPETAVALQALGAGGIFPSQTGIDQWFVASAAPVTWAQIKQLNAHGFVVTSRSVILHPPPRSDVPLDQTAQGRSFDVNSQRRNREIAALLAGMVLLEIIMLAGPAFAVGARKRQYELALVSAAGGERRQLATIVLADGAFLGAVAAAAGTVLGIGAASVVLAALPHLTGRVPGGVKLVAPELIGIGLLAVVTGLLAALVPAVLATRRPTAVVLAARRAPSARSRRPAIAGLVCLAAALVLGLGTLAGSQSALVLVTAAALGELGCALIAPALLTLTGRVATRLPLWPRLALREAARNRSAAAPAVAAIIAVVAAAAAVFIYGATASTHDRLTYQPYIYVGDAVAPLNGRQATVAATATRQLRADLPGADVAALQGSSPALCPAVGGGLNAACRQVIVDQPPVTGCPTLQFGPESGVIGEMLQGPIPAGGHCALGPPQSNVAPILVDDGSAIARVIGGADGRAAAAALASGRALVFDPSLVDHGMATLSFSSGQPTHAVLPAVAVHSTVPLAEIVIPPSEVSPLGLDVGTVALYVKHATSQPAARIRAADLDLAALGIGELAIESGYQDRIGTGLLAVAVGDLILTFGAALAATALMAVDGRDDLMTLAAVGAAPSGRRRLAMARAGVLCLVGAVFGTVAGVIPGIGLVWRIRRIHANEYLYANGPRLNNYPLTIPWLGLAAVIVAAPLLAAATAAVVTRAKLPAERRGAW